MSNVVSIKRNEFNLIDRIAKIVKDDVILAYQIFKDNSPHEEKGFVFTIEQIESFLRNSVAMTFMLALPEDETLTSVYLPLFLEMISIGGEKITLNLLFVKDNFTLMSHAISDFYSECSYEMVLSVGDSIVSKDHGESYMPLEVPEGYFFIPPTLWLWEKTHATFCLGDGENGAITYTLTLKPPGE